ncbi:MAG: leucine-rich repeat domain-containing protein, partial [Treponema sp.]|nr:leucine-rich repeat domain-containing protein [Treponema sp.]
MKKMVLAFVVLAMMALVGCASGPRLTTEHIAWEAENPQYTSARYFNWGHGYRDGVRTGSVLITGYRGTSTDIRIPSQINGMPVTQIQPRAFARAGLTSVTIPDSVVHIL